MEHHLKEEEIKNIYLDNYNLGAYSCRQTHKLRGVCIFISKILHFSTINLANFTTEKELQICAIKLSLQELNFIVICIYRSPTGNFTYFLEQLESVLETIHNTSHDLILCGDLNIDYIKDSSKKHSLDYLLASFNLFSTVNFPTRIFKNSSTIIDNMYVNKHKFNISVYPVVNGLSDHDAQIMAFRGISTPTPKQIHTFIRKINNTTNEFLHNLRYVNWENVFTEADVNVILNNFLNTYLKIFYASFPIVKLKQAHKPKPWITKGIKISYANKRKLYLTYRNSNNPSLKEHFKKYC